MEAGVVLGCEGIVLIGKLNYMLGGRKVMHL